MERNKRQRKRERGERSRERWSGIERWNGIKAERERG